MEKEAVRKLSDLGLIQDVDLGKLKEVVRKAQGLPVRVSISKAQSEDEGMYPAIQVSE